MNVLRLESHLASVTNYLARLKVAASRINADLWPRETFQNNLECLMAQLNEIPGRVQVWMKSSARCSIDVALSLVRVHCKEVKEEKLVALKVANTKRHNFQSLIRPFCIMLLYQYLLHYGQLLHIMSQYLCLFSLILQGLHKEGECRLLEFWAGKGANIRDLFCTTPKVLKLHESYFWK